MIVLQLIFAEAAFETSMERVRGVGRDLAAEQIEREREMHIGLLLDGRQVDDPKLADRRLIVRVVNAGRLHGLAGALDHACDAGLADEHVMSFFGQYEAAGARERIEAGLSKRLQLHLAVTVGEKRE